MKGPVKGEESEGGERQEVWPPVGNVLSLIQSAPRATSSGRGGSDGFLKQQQLTMT